MTTTPVPVTVDGVLWWDDFPATAPPHNIRHTEVLSARHPLTGKMVACREYKWHVLVAEWNDRLNVWEPRLCECLCYRALDGAETYKAYLQGHWTTSLQKDTWTKFGKLMWTHMVSLPPNPRINKNETSRA